MTTFKLSLGMPVDHKLVTGDPLWPAFTNSFVNYEVSADSLAVAVEVGTPFGPWFRQMPRSKDTFWLAQHIAVDLDTEDSRSTYDGVMSNPTTRLFGGIWYETPSCTPARPRGRLVFFLDQPILVGAKYDVAARLMAMLYDADIACAECSRCWYGALGGQVRVMGNTLPLSYLRSLYSSHKERFEPLPTKPYIGDATSKLNGLASKVAAASNGSRNNMLNWAAYQARSVVQAGQADERTVEEFLVSAAIQAGLSETEARRTAKSGLRAQ